MGRSTSINTSTAIDNRLAVTDSAFGLSSSGQGNNTALQGDIFNLKSSILGGAKGQPSGGESGGITINKLDGGAIDKAFNFAGYSLSAMLDSIITGQKVNQQAAQYTADAIGSALTQTATTNAAASAAATAASAELDTEKTATGKKLLIGLGVLGAGYWYFKGRK